MVVGIIALLMAFGLPSIKALWSSFGQALPKATVNSLLTCSRATAQLRRYAGVKFELRDNRQWAVPVVQDPNSNHYFDETTIVLIPAPARQEVCLGNSLGVAPVTFDSNKVVILFSPQGKLVIKSIALYPDETIETSRNRLVFYDIEEWGQCTTGEEQEAFIQSLDPYYVNTYTGRLIQ